jgi:cardiolipin hydrolase
MADNYCYVCVYTITNDKLARVLYTLKQAGVDVRVISDDETATNDGSDLAKLANAGIPVRIDTDP